MWRISKCENLLGNFKESLEKMEEKERKPEFNGAFKKLKMEETEKKI